MTTYRITGTTSRKHCTTAPLSYLVQGDDIRKVAEQFREEHPELKLVRIVEETT